MNTQARTRKSSAKHSARLGAYLAAGLGTSTVATPTADAAIVYFDVKPDIAMSDAKRVFKFNLSNGTYVVSSNANEWQGQTRFRFDSALIRDNTFGIDGSYIGIAIYNSSGDLSQLAFGAAINAGTSAFWDSYSYGGSFYTPTGWNGTNTSGYAGLRINAGGGNYNYGWVKLNWTESPDILNISGFAFETSYNTAILAGATASVPEASSSLLALVAGGAALTRRRRQRAA